jgi:putative proteasome-type protease
MHIFEPAPDRLFVLLAAGNLATTQAVVNRIRRDLSDRNGSDAGGLMIPAPGRPDLLSARYLF